MREEFVVTRKADSGGAAACRLSLTAVRERAVDAGRSSGDPMLGERDDVAEDALACKCGSSSWAGD